MACVVALRVQFRVEDDDVLAYNVEEFLVGGFVQLGFAVVDWLADVVDADPVDPVKGGVEEGLGRVFGGLLLEENVVVFYYV